MKAIGIMSYGGPEVLEVIDIPEVNVGYGEIRIKNFASAVNPTDIVARSGMIAKFRKENPVFPSVPGMDVAGIVDQIGEGVTTDIKIGDRVMGMLSPMEIMVLIGSNWFLTKVQLFWPPKILHMKKLVRFQ